MKAYEIEGWLKGAKIRRNYWPAGGYIYIDIDGVWWDEKGNRVSDQIEMSVPEFEKDYWELYQEPKQPKTITMYRYTYIWNSEAITQSVWKACNWDDYMTPLATTECKFKLLKTESKEVELDQ